MGLHWLDISSILKRRPIVNQRSNVRPSRSSDNGQVPGRPRTSFVLSAQRRLMLTSKWPWNKCTPFPTPFINCVMYKVYANIIRCNISICIYIIYIFIVKGYHRGCFISRSCWNMPAICGTSSPSFFFFRAACSFAAQHKIHSAVPHKTSRKRWNYGAHSLCCSISPLAVNLQSRQVAQMPRIPFLFILFHSKGAAATSLY